MARTVRLLSLLLMLFVQGFILSEIHQVLTATPPDVHPSPSTSSFCRSGHVLDGVYNAGRLRVVNSCITVAGTVAKTKRMADGDYHLDVILDAPYANLINRRNLVRQQGALVVEVVPVDQDVVSRPQVGDHVQVTGAYVLDEQHGWMEIHPTWEIRQDGPNRSAPAEGSRLVDHILDFGLVTLVYYLGLGLLNLLALGICTGHVIRFALRVWPDSSSERYTRFLMWFAVVTIAALDLLVLVEALD